MVPMVVWCMTEVAVVTMLVGTFIQLMVVMHSKHHPVPAIILPQHPSTHLVTPTPDNMSYVG